jgi:hypothetical protein
MEALSRQAYATPQREQGSPRQATSPTGTHNVALRMVKETDCTRPLQANLNLGDIVQVAQEFGS